MKSISAWLCIDCDEIMERCPSGHCFCGSSAVVSLRWLMASREEREEWLGTIQPPIELTEVVEKGEP